MPAKIIKKGSAVLLRQKQTIQGSIIESDVFMHRKRLCVKLIGFNSIVPVANLEVI